MILDKSRLTTEKFGPSIKYVYNFPNENNKVILITLAAVPHEGTITYYVSKSIEGTDGKILVDDDTRFSTDDLKAAWEKFEDYFEETQKEENPQQGGEEPEVQILCMSVNKNGHSYVFLQKEDGTQELLFELDIDNYDIINTKPKFASLDFTGNAAIQEPFNTEWALGLVDDITFVDAQVDSTTYVVALKSVDQPGQGPDGPPEGPTTPPEGPTTPPEGPTTPPEGPTTPPDGPIDGPTDGPPEDDEDKKPVEKSNAKVTPIEFSSAVKEISDKTGLSPDNIEAALRTERTFDTFLTLNKVNVNELKDKLNASALTRNQFIKQVVNDFKKI